MSKSKKADENMSETERRLAAARVALEATQEARAEVVAALEAVARDEERVDEQSRTLDLADEAALDALAVLQSRSSVKRRRLESEFAERSTAVAAAQQEVFAAEREAAGEQAAALKRTIMAREEGAFEALRVAMRALVEEGFDLDRLATDCYRLECEAGHAEPRRHNWRLNGGKKSIEDAIYGLVDSTWGAVHTEYENARRAEEAVLHPRPVPSPPREPEFVATGGAGAAGDLALRAAVLRAAGGQPTFATTEFDLYKES